MIDRARIEDLGGKPWMKTDGTVRVYLNDDVWAPMIGLSVERYRTGNVCSARLGGERISNAKATRYLASKVFWEAGRIYVTGELERDGLTDAITNAVSRAIVALDA